MRRKITIQKLTDFIKKLAGAAKGPGSVYLVGGSSALLLGIRDQTIDIDLKLDPEPPGIFEAIAKLKEELDINIELAAPDDFIPVPPDWKENCRHIDSINGVNFFHYNFALQALAKLERGYDQDLSDVKAYIERGLVTTSQIKEALSKVKGLLIRYPALNADVFEQNILEFLRKETKG